MGSSKRIKIIAERFFKAGGYLCSIETPASNVDTPETHKAD